MHSNNVKALPPATDDYANVSKAVGGFVAGMNDNQPGDPNKAAGIMNNVVKGEDNAIGKPMPERLPLGPDVLRIIRKKCTETLEIYQNWESVIAGTILMREDKIWTSG